MMMVIGRGVGGMESLSKKRGEKEIENLWTCTTRCDYRVGVDVEEHMRGDKWWWRKIQWIKNKLKIIIKKMRIKLSEKFLDVISTKYGQGLGVKTGKITF